MPSTLRTLNQALLHALDRFHGATCFQVRRGGRFRDVSYRYVRRQSLRLAHFLSQNGLKGERLAIWAPNSPEWLVAHNGALFAGGIVVPLRFSLGRQSILELLKDCAPRVVAVETSEQASWLLAEKAAFPELELVLTIDGSETLPGVFDLVAITQDKLESSVVDEVIERAQAIPPNAAAAIFYTSAQGGQPIGALFDQRQRLESWLALRQWLELEDDELGYTTLPLSYVANLQIALLYFLEGVPNVLSGGRELILEEVQQTSPTMALTTPNALERMYEEAVASGNRRLPESSQAMFNWALATGKEFRAAGEEASVELRDRFERADRTFFSRIRGGFGGRFRRFLCTGAPLRSDLAETIGAIGIEALNLYSLTESGGFPAAQRPGHRRPDASGVATPGFELRVAGDGELQIKSATLMLGYWRRREETAQTLVDKWLRTGDFARLEADGSLYLTGRSGDTLILSSGRRVSPVEIEQRLLQSPLIDQAVVFGEGRPYLVALLVPDLDKLADCFRELALETPDDLIKSGIRKAPTSSLQWFWNDEASGAVVTSAHPRVKEMLDRVIDEVNAQGHEWESIKAYALVGQQLSREAHQIADDLAHDRAQLEQRVSEILAALYPLPAKLAPGTIKRVEVGPERLRELLEKESILDAWTGDAGIEFLFDLARALQIDAPSVVHICDCAAGVAQMESERVPLSTALIVGDPNRIHRVLDPSLIQLHRHEHIRRMYHRIVDLARLVDGQVLAFVVDRHGYVRGICRLQLEDMVPDGDAILGPQFRLHAEISSRCDAVVFLVPKGGRQVRVFAGGQLVGRYTHGDWAPESSLQVEQMILDLAARRGFGTTLLRRLLRCAFRMAEENLGALFMVGDAKAVLAKSDEPDISYLARLASAPVSELSDEHLVNLAKQDGATIIDAATEEFRGCMILLRPAASTAAETGPGKGARHSSAAKMSAEVGALAIVVSQDGPITVYDAGRRLLSL